MCDLWYNLELAEGGQYLVEVEVEFYTIILYKDGKNGAK